MPSLPKQLPAMLSCETGSRTACVSQCLSDLPLEDRPNALDEHGPIFIQGAPRSGTTFLAEALARLNEIEEVTGNLSPPRTMHLLGRMTRDGQDTRELTKCVRDIFWQAFWRRRYSASERLVSVLRGRTSLAHMLPSKKSLTGLKFLYKEPFICFAMDALAEEFPNCRMLHIIRDGRDVADSLDRMYPQALSDDVLRDPVRAANKNSEIGFWRDFEGWCIPWWIPEGKEETFIAATKYGRCMWLWRDMVDRGQIGGAQLGPKRYLEIRYEELVKNPTEQGHRIVEFLGCSMNSRCLAYLRKAYKSSVNIHHQRSGDTDFQTTESIAGETLRLLGYA